MTGLVKACLNNQKDVEAREMEILSHSAWHGDLSGIECEDLLRGSVPGSYLLREGERKGQYYLSFVIGDSFSFKHQPFVITCDNSHTVWGYQNGAHRWASNLEELVPMVLHCELDKCYPVVQNIHGK